MRKILLMTIPAICSVVSCNFTNTNSKQEAVDEPIVPQVVTAESIYSSSIDKVALVIAYKDEIPFSQGSAFFIGPTTAITNYHVISGCDRVELKFSNSEDIIKNVAITKGAEDYDLAILETRKEFPYFCIDSLNTEGIGSKIYTIGNPRGLEGTISDGIISGKRESDGIDFIQITAPISPGNSGGPLLNEKGNVIGVSSFTFKNSQNLNFAIPIKYISECIEYVPNKGKSSTKISGSVGSPIEVIDFLKDYTSPDFTFSIKNKTSDFVKNIEIVFICKNPSGEIIDYSILTFHESIAPGLAKRFSYSGLFKASRYFVSQNGSTAGYFGYGMDRPVRFKMEYRVLGYEIDED